MRPTARGSISSAGKPKSVAAFRVAAPGAPDGLVLVYVQRPAVHEPGVKPARRQLAVETQARGRECSHHVRGLPAACRRGRRKELHEPRDQSWPQADSQRAVASEEVADSIAQLRRARERRGMARADQSGVARRASRSELRPSLDQRHPRPALGQFECDADPNGATPDDHHVRVHQYGTVVIAMNSALSGVSLRTVCATKPSKIATSLAFTVYSCAPYRSVIVPLTTQQKS